MHRSWLAGLLILAAPLFASAQAPPSIKLVRIGLPASGKGGDDSGRSRSGAWAPVAVALESGAADVPLYDDGSLTGKKSGYRLRITTTDLEEQSYQYTVAVPSMAANYVGTVTGYIVPGSDSAVFAVQLETAEGRVVAVRDKLTRDYGRAEIVAPNDILFLAAGAGLSSLKQAIEKLDKRDEKQADAKDKPQVDPQQPAEGPRGKRQFAYAEDLSALPDRWFGYDAVDVVVLATGKADFVTALASGDADSFAGRRRAALVEWVRRGGQLVMSVGRNQQQVAALLRQMPLIACTVEGSKPGVALPELARFSRTPGEPLNNVEAAVLKPGLGVHVVVQEKFGPVLLTASCGMGRVMLAGFDFDSGEFAGWRGQAGFWREVQNIVSPHIPPPRQGGNQVWMKQKGGMVAVGADQSDDYDMRDEVKRSLERFEELPTVSFAYVALFLLLYIALVGPLDYFLLKKVFKRLELTWVTFPVTVIVVSVAAYFTAYAMKGDELRINKIDLIDIDMHPLLPSMDANEAEKSPRQAYGRSWFTLFSPRAQSYTVGIEPNVGVWTDKAHEKAAGSVVTLLEGGDNTRRQASAALFEKPYLYADDAAGLRYVPVPVWSTRSFTASWSAPLMKDKPPIGITGKDGPIRAARGEGGGLAGELTNNLPVTLQDVCLFYHDKWYFLGDLEPQDRRSVEQFFARDEKLQRRGMKDFLDDNAQKPPLAPRIPPLAPSGRLVGKGFDRDENGNPLRVSHRVVKPMLFYQRAGYSMSNPGLRTIDQSWRLATQPSAGDGGRYRDEAILVARTPLLCDYAKVANEHAASASRLWLGKLPDGESPPPIAGVITQDTYVRVFIPVARR